MICIILVGGLENSLENELMFDNDLRGIPRALLPVGKRRMLDYWWECIMSTKEITSIYLVCNALNFRHFERWATSVGLPHTNIVNTGSTSVSNALGAARDLNQGIKRAIKHHQSVKDVCVIAGDSLFFREFDLPQVLECYKRHQRKSGDVSLVLYYQLGEKEPASKRGIIEICSFSKKVTGFQEKPAQPKSRLASPLFYVLGKEGISHLDEFVRSSVGVMTQPSTFFSCGRFIESLHTKSSVYGLRLPSGFSLIGVSADIKEYRKLVESFDPVISATPQTAAMSAKHHHPRTRIVKRCWARCGLLGNPSDGFFGKTMACTIGNFYAEVILEESDKLELVPHPLFDVSQFGDLNDLYSNVKQNGYSGGLRLLLGTCKKFAEYCLENSIALPRKNFTIRYDTTIPRQVGLSGSSAIVTALFRALMEFYGLTEDDIAKPLQPNFILSVETEEMMIQGGLQDRVAQLYEGLVYMDFASVDVDKYGKYEEMSCSLLPADLLFLAYRAEPSDSGKIHSDVKQRWLNGDQVVIDAMKKFGSFAEKGKDALARSDFEAFGNLMNENFDLRRSLYGDDVIGASNLEMIEIARRYNASAKFPGSGGAIIGLAQCVEDISAIREAFEDAGCVFVTLEPT